MDFVQVVFRWIQTGNGLLWIIGFIFVAVVFTLLWKLFLFRVLVYFLTGCVAFLALLAVLNLFLNSGGLPGLIQAIQKLGNAPTANVGSGPKTQPTPFPGSDEPSPSATSEQQSLPTEYSSGELTTTASQQCTGGQVFALPIEVTNTGKAWSGVRLARLFGQASDKQIDVPETPPGGLANVTISLTCPAFDPNTNTGRIVIYQLEAPDGVRFGPVFRFSYYASQ